MGRSKAVLPAIAAVAFLLLRVSSTLADGAASAAPASDAGAPLFQLSLYDPVWLDAAPQVDKKAATAASQTAAIFKRGTWDFEVSGAHMSPVRSTRDYFDSGTTALGYFIADNFSVNAAIVGYTIDQPDHGAFAGGFDLYARFYFLTLDRFTFYFDAGAGAFMADKEVPERGTNFDFTPRSGLGVGYRLADNLFFLAGIRYWHLSNAGIEGESRNPSFDGLQYYGSIMFTF